MSAPRMSALLLAACLLPACTPLNRFMKAKPTEPGEKLLRFEATPRLATARSPWHYAAYSTDQKLQAAAAQRKSIFIAPVFTGELRPISRTLARSEYASRREEHKQAAARAMREEFAKALTAGDAPLFHRADRPGRDTLILELSLLELDPTSAKGNVTKTLLKYTTGPLVSMGVGFFTGGSIAIEGRLREGRTGRIVMQFADREKDKATLYNARDYMALGHSERTVREWAEQFAAFLRDSRRPVKDSFFFTPHVY